MDQKIELLVRSVLAAVDQRLQEVRDEVHALAADVEQRHQQVLKMVQDVQRTMDRTAADARRPAGAADPLAARMEQATQVLLERIEAMHQRNTIATNERFAAMSAAIDQLRFNATPVATGPSPLRALDAVDAPLKMSTITGQHTIVAPLLPTQPIVASSHPVASPAATSAEPAAAPDPAPAAAADAAESTTTTAATTVHESDIDIDRLADLLSERLGHLSLPPRPN